MRLVVSVAPDRHRHGRILLSAGSGAGIVLHRDHFAGVNDLRTITPGQAWLNSLPLPDQHDLRAISLVRLQRALDDLLRRVIAAHCVDKYFQSLRTSLSFCKSERIRSARSEIAAFLFRFPFTR